MDVNYKRYCDAINIQGWDKNTFLNKWKRRWVNKFNKFFKKEFDFCNGYEAAYINYEHEVKNRSIYDIVSDDEYKRIENTYNPIKKHKIIWHIANIPFHIEHWLCCGWKLHYDKEIKQWTFIDRYHMMTKLCRYGYLVWPEYKFTWWDRLRFKWITGFDFEETRENRY